MTSGIFSAPPASLERQHSSRWLPRKAGRRTGVDPPPRERDQAIDERPSSGRRGRATPRPLLTHPVAKIGFERRGDRAQLDRVMRTASASLHFLVASSPVLVGSPLVLIIASANSSGWDKILEQLRRVDRSAVLGFEGGPASARRERGGGSRALLLDSRSSMSQHLAGIADQRPARGSATRLRLLALPPAAQGLFLDRREASSGARQARRRGAPSWPPSRRRIGRFLDPEVGPDLVLEAQLPGPGARRVILPEAAVRDAERRVVLALRRRRESASSASRGATSRSPSCPWPRPAPSTTSSGPSTADRAAARARRS